MQHIKNRRPQWPAIFSFSDNLIFSPFSPQTSQDMKDTPSYKRSEHIIKNIVELKQSDLKIELTEFYRAAYSARNEKHCPERAFFQRISQDKSQRKKE